MNIEAGIKKLEFKAGQVEIKQYEKMSRKLLLEILYENSLLKTPLWNPILKTASLENSFLKLILKTSYKAPSKNSCWKLFLENTFWKLRLKTPP